MNPKKKTNKRKAPALGILLEDLGQHAYPREFRIDQQVLVHQAQLPTDEGVDKPPKKPRPPVEVAAVEALAGAANSLWYLKTKFFKRDWANDDGYDDDPKVRNALGRLLKGIDAIKLAGIEIEDRTNMRYPEGGGNLMKPINFVPTEGLTYHKVTETTKPIIFYKDQLIQPGEVFVAVPMEPAAAGTTQAPEPIEAFPAPTGESAPPPQGSSRASRTSKQPRDASGDKSAE